RDIVTLSLALIRDFPEYYPYFSTKYFIYKGKKVANHNHLMSRYLGMDGIKTGYINASGFNLATSAVQKGKRVVGAIFGGTSAKARDHDMEKLLNASFTKLNGGLEAGGQMAEEGEKPTIKQSPALKEAVKKETETKDRKKLAALAEKHGVQDKKKGQNVATRDDDDDDDWSVQIGAFKTRQAGEKALKVARRKSRTLKTKGVPKIEAMVRKGKTLYRVKFTGLASSEAKNVCKKIQECTPLPPNS
ncbi:MAG: D-alanyl-D-alanine carboxypeptidase, partial [Alphaproteobacteria bacterium]